MSTMKSSNSSIVSSFKYLGVTIDTKLLFVEHVRSVCTRARKVLQDLGRYVRSFWDVDVKSSMEAIYQMTIVSMMSYVSEVWGHRLWLTRMRRDLLEISGIATKVVAQCYFSTFYEAACVLAGILSLDLEVARVDCLKHLRWDLRAEYLGREIDENLIA